MKVECPECDQESRVTTVKTVQVIMLFIIQIGQNRQRYPSNIQYSAGDTITGYSALSVRRDYVDKHAKYRQY